MKRAPIVIGATAAGLAVVLGFHSKAPTSSLVKTVGSGTSTSAGGTTSSSAGTSTNPPSSSTSSSSGTSGTSSTSGTGGTSGTSGATSTTTKSPSTSTTAPSTTTRSATGALEQTQYGDVQVKVTVKGSRITSVQTVQLTAFDPRSQYINSAAAPLLQQEAMQAQSANIQAISGASYTSAAYIASLQSALDQLGLK